MIDLIDSPYFQKTVGPQYTHMYNVYTSLHRVKEPARLRSERVAAICLGLLVETLRAVREYVMLEIEKAKLDEVLNRATDLSGKAQAGEVVVLEPLKYRQIGKLSEDKLRDIILRLNYQARYKGISSMLSALIDYLATY